MRNVAGDGLVFALLRILHALQYASTSTRLGLKYLRDVPRSNFLADFVLHSFASRCTASAEAYPCRGMGMAAKNCNARAAHGLSG